MNVIIGERYSHKLLKPLINQGFQVALMPDNPCVDARLASHVDLSIIVLPDKNIVVSEHLYGNENIVNHLTNRNFKIHKIEKSQAAVYPGDAALCACICGNTLIHNTEITDQAILNAFSGNIINVNQGYSNCTICALDDRSVITSDSGIASKLISVGWDVLKIEQGMVELQGFDYGFIGGASFAVKNTLYFTGRFPCDTENVIEEFAEARKKKVVYLTNEKAFDIGGAMLFD